MQHKVGLDKVGLIISISNNYLNHKKNISKIKGLVDHSSPKRNLSISQYLSRQNNYKQIRHQILDKKLMSENQQVLKRITSISTRKRQTNRNSSKQSQRMKKTLSNQIREYKTRINFMKGKQMERKNSEFNKRIKNAHFKDGLSPESYRSTCLENSNYKKVHSKYSERSKSQMKEILDGLKYDHKKIPFLPIVSPKNGKVI